MATTEYKLQATPGGSEVTAILVKPGNAFSLMVLGPGAGTPIHRPLMVQLADALADQGVATFRYNYPYGEREQVYSVESIDPLDVLLATTAAAQEYALALLPDLPLFLGGRSMSAQVVSLALTHKDWPDVRGVVLYVFPSRWRHVMDDTVGHLQGVPVPMLFVQGSRDEEAPLPELEALLEDLGNRAVMHVIEGANHSYDMPPESDRTQKDAIKESASVTARWMQALVQLEDGA
ncbi:MAG: hypothetical protein OXN15_00595 [Chloroflexota bacterium]|nr:hypothetical protein [Chloroflexota bacterium]MDE2969854.1 hypothetical protein [Chloroflexota bacterium]